MTSFAKNGGDKRIENRNLLVKFTESTQNVDISKVYQNTKILHQTPDAFITFGNYKYVGS